MTIEEKLDKLLRVQMENQPSVDSDRFFVGDSDVISASTSLTLTFVLDPLYVVRLVEGYCDVREGLSYQWVINGVALPLSELKYYLGKAVHSDIKLIITNATGTDQEVAYYIYGWGDLKGVS